MIDKKTLITMALAVAIGFFVYDLVKKQLAKSSESDSYDADN